MTKQDHRLTLKLPFWAQLTWDVAELASSPLTLGAFLGFWLLLSL